jgi:hypothetical protein
MCFLELGWKIFYITINFVFSLLPVVLNVINVIVIHDYDPEIFEETD